ncbi:MAG: DHA2 family efflux MFS transporter permease subunit [Nocardioides sp.]
MPIATSPFAGHSVAKPPGQNRWLVLAVLCGSLLLVALDATILNVALPSLAADLAPSAAGLLWIVDVYSLVLAGLLVTTGTLGDRFGRKRLLLAGFVVFGAASAATAFAPSTAALIASRAALGVGGAMIMPATLSIIRAVFTDRRELSLAIGIWGAVGAGGAAVGPVIGGVLLEHFWWGSAFLINVPVMVVAVVLGAWLLPESRASRARSWDPTSAVLSLVGMVALLYAVKTVGSDGITVEAVAAAGSAVALLTGFVRRQSRLAEPLLDLTLFGNRGFAAAVGCVVLALFGLFAMMFFLTQHFQLVLGYSPMKAGLLLSPATIASLLAAPAIGALVTRFGSRMVVGFGFTAVAAGFGLLAGVRVDSPYLLIAAALVLLGLGATVAMTAASQTIMSTAPAERAGGAAAIQETGYELGGALGVAVLGSVMTARYAAELQPVPGVRQGAMSAARESLAGAAAVAEDLGGVIGARLYDAAIGAFVAGFDLTVGIAGVVMAAVAIAAFFLLPARGGVDSHDTQIPPGEG